MGAAYGLLSVLRSRNKLPEPLQDRIDDVACTLNTAYENAFGATVQAGNIELVSTLAGLTGLGVVANCSSGALKLSTALSFLFLLAAGYLLLFGGPESNRLARLLVCVGVGIPVIFFGTGIYTAGGRKTDSGHDNLIVIQQNVNPPRRPQTVPNKRRRLSVSPRILRLLEEINRLRPSTAS